MPLQGRKFDEVSVQSLSLSCEPLTGKAIGVKDGTILVDLCQQLPPESEVRVEFSANFCVAGVVKSSEPHATEFRIQIRCKEDPQTTPTELLLLRVLCGEFSEQQACAAATC